jgi:hypothetical protein
LGWDGANRMANDSSGIGLRRMGVLMIVIFFVFLFLVVTYLVDWTFIDILPTKSRMKKKINGTK